MMKLNMISKVKNDEIRKALTLAQQQIADE
jgi:hypothetical protein